MGKYDEALRETPLSPDRVDRRNLVTLLLDTSESMGQKRSDGSAPIDELNAAMTKFLAVDLPNERVLSTSGEIAVCSFFGRGTDWIHLAATDIEGSHPFYPVGGLRLQKTLTAKGETPIGTAILEGLKMINGRVDRLGAMSPPRRSEHRPVLYLVTDGQPQGDSPERLEEARDQLRAAERAHEVLFFSVGTTGADMDYLASLSIGGATNAYDLRERSLGELLQFVSRSSEATFEAAEVGDVNLPVDLADDVTDARDARLTYVHVRNEYERDFWRRLDGQEPG